MLYTNARQIVKKFHMLTKGSLVVVGLSGGADSVALLHFLSRLKEEYELSLLAVHVHHGLRGQAADFDANFAMEFSKSLSIPFEPVKVDVVNEAKKRGLGTEETGRIVRYEAFQSFATANGSSIAVAHNQNDQAETVLMRLCRGAGATGLSGIRPIRENIIRPLLYCSRAEIEAYCELEGLSYCTDKTNFENDYTRNKIRNCLLPWLTKELNSKSAENIAKSAEILAEEEIYMEKEGERAVAKAMVSLENTEISLNRSILLSSPTAIRRRAFRHALKMLEPEFRDFSQEHIEQLDKLLIVNSGKTLSLPHNLQAEAEYENLLIYKKKSNDILGYSYKLIPEKIIFIKEANKYVKLSYNAENTERNFGKIYTEVFDYDKIDAVLYCRSRLPADKLAISGGHSKKIKDFFVDEKIPKHQRNLWPLIAFDKEIIWVTGKRRALGFDARKDSKNIAVIEIWEGNGNEGESGNADNQNSNKQAD